MAGFIQVGASRDSLADVPTPTTVQPQLCDVSASDAGRVLDQNATMYKNRVTQKRKVALGWKNPSGEVVSQILRAFNPEYVFVRYLDPMSNSYETREFYVGDRTMPLREVHIGGSTYSQLSFNIIER